MRSCVCLWSYAASTGSKSSSTFDSGQPNRSLYTHTHTHTHTQVSVYAVASLPDSIQGQRRQAGQKDPHTELSICVTHRHTMTRTQRSTPMCLAMSALVTDTLTCRRYAAAAGRVSPTQSSFCSYPREAACRQTARRGWGSSRGRPRSDGCRGVCA